jgi:hypothetical protein
MRRVGFEHMIPVFERAKTVHTLDHAVTVIGVPVEYIRAQLSYKRSRLVEKR